MKTDMDAPNSLHATIDALADFPERLKRLFYCFPPELHLWAPPSWDGIPSEKLNAIEQICHVRDVEIEGYRIRFERTRRETSPVLPDLPGESMAQERRYSAQDPLAALRDFARARALNVEVIRHLTDDEFKRTAIFEGKVTTLKGLIHFLCSHDFQHLSGLQWLLARNAQTQPFP